MGKSQLLQRFTQTLFEDSDEYIKSGFNREKYCNLNRRKVEEVLGEFSFEKALEKKYDFSIDEINKTIDEIKSEKSLLFSNIHFVKDLKYSIGIWREEGNGFLFDSIQDYYGAKHISQQSKSVKKDLYGRIVHKIKSEREVDYSDLAEFCWELDKQDYTLFLVLPLLRKIQVDLGKKTDSFFIQKMVKFFFQRIKAESIENKKFKVKSNTTSVSIYKMLPNKFLKKLRINEIGNELSEFVKNTTFNKNLFPMNQFSEFIFFEEKDNNILLIQEYPILKTIATQLHNNINMTIKLIEKDQHVA